MLGRRRMGGGRGVGLEGIVGACALEVAQDPVDDGQVGEEGDHLHLDLALGAKKRVHFEDSAEQAG